MAQLARLLNFWVLFFVFFCVVFNHLSLLWFLLFLPLWYLYMQAAAVRQGQLWFKNSEWEKGPFDYESLPFAIRKFFSDGEAFLRAQGFQFGEEALYTLGTNGFGRSEIKSLMKQFVNPDTKEWAIQTLTFTWNPNTTACLLITCRWRFISYCQGKQHVTTNNRHYSKTQVETPLFRSRHLNELDPTVLLARHREWMKQLLAPVETNPKTFREYIRDVSASDQEFTVQLGYLFEDINQNGYRNTFKGVVRALKIYYKIDRSWKPSITAVRGFFWKIRPKLNDDILRKMTDEGEKGGQQRLAGFRMDFWSLFWNRIFNFSSKGWLIFFGLLVFWTHVGNFYELYGGFTWTHAVYGIAGIILDFCLLVALVSLLTFFAPAGGGRFAAMFGHRLFKFYDDVICFESPHGVISCVLGNFPEAKKIGSWLWVKVPGVASFVLRPGQFEGEGYQVFLEEMDKKRLVKRFLAPRLLLAVFALSAVVMAWGMCKVDFYKRTDPLQYQGVFNGNQAVIVAYQQTQYHKSPDAGMAWLPAIYLCAFDEEYSRKSSMSVEIWRVGADGVHSYPVTCRGTYALHLIPSGKDIYWVTQSFNRRNREYAHFIYRLGNSGAEWIKDGEAAKLSPAVTQTQLVYTEGWQPIGCNADRDQKDCVQPLPQGYEFFDEWKKEGPINQWSRAFGIKKGVRTVFRNEDKTAAYSVKSTLIPQTEYDRMIAVE